MIRVRISVFFLLAVLFVGCKVNHLAEVEYAAVVVDGEQGQAVDSTVLAMIGPYRQKLEADMNEIIGYLAEPVSKGYPESTVGNMVADILAEQASAYLGQPVDFAVANSGGLRIPEIPAGPVTRRAIYELLPFDNMLVVLLLRGKTVMVLADHMAARGGWPVSRAFRMRIDQGRAVDVRIGEQPIDPDATYLVAMPDYIANGGDDCSFLAKAEQLGTGRFMRDAVIEYLEAKNKAGQPLRFSLDGRVTRQK